MSPLTTTQEQYTLREEEFEAFVEKFESQIENEVGLWASIFQYIRDQCVKYKAIVEQYMP